MEEPSFYRTRGRRCPTAALSPPIDHGLQLRRLGLLFRSALLDWVVKELESHRLAPTIRYGSADAQGRGGRRLARPAGGAVTGELGATGGLKLRQRLG